SASWPRWVRCPWHARPTVAHLPWFHHPELELVASRAEGPYLINRQSPNPIAFGCQFRHPGLVARTFHFGNRLPHTCRSWAGNYRERERPPDPAEGSDSQILPYVTLPSSTRRATNAAAELLGDEVAEELVDVITAAVGTAVERETGMTQQPERPTPPQPERPQPPQPECPS